MKIVIIGGGVAAFESALAARKNSETAEIEMYCREKVLPYRRPALSGMVAEDLDDVRFFFRNRDFYERSRIFLHLGVEALKLDVPEHRVSFNNGESVDFDRLIIASGGRAFVPELGVPEERVAVLREYADLLRLRKLLDTGDLKKVVILGGGVLGLELAESLLARKVEVAIVDNAPELMSRNLDKEAGELLLKHLSMIPGLSFHLGVTVTGERDGMIILSDGTSLEAQLLCVSAGVRANTRIAADAGLKCGRGIVVDDHMLVEGTCDIFAAGDVAEFAGKTSSLFCSARDMGRIAGANAAGGDFSYVPECAPVRFAAFGVKIFSVGNCSGKGVGTGDISNYRKLFYDKEDKLCGAVLMGDLSNALELQSAVGK